MLGPAQRRSGPKSEEIDAWTPAVPGAQPARFITSPGRRQLLKGRDSSLDILDLGRLMGMVGDNLRGSDPDGSRRIIPRWSMKDRPHLEHSWTASGMACCSRAIAGRYAARLAGYAASNSGTFIERSRVPEPTLERQPGLEIVHPRWCPAWPLSLVS
jgi:hypothetical protein